MSRAGPKIGHNWETFMKRSEKEGGKKNSLGVWEENHDNDKEILSFRDTVEFLLPCTSQIVGNTILFLLHKFHSCREENAAWKH